MTSFDLIVSGYMNIEQSVELNLRLFATFVMNTELPSLGLVFFCIQMRPFWKKYNKRIWREPDV